MSAPSTHFKSTDGHKNINNFSLKRINLQFLDTACSAASKDGAVIIVDASKYKVLPDSFRRTLPIWCTVLNRLVVALGEKLCRNRQFVDTNGNINWDTDLYTPSNISREEHEVIKEIIPERVRSALESGVIIDEEWFLEILQKPLRCFWISPEVLNYDNDDDCWECIYSKIDQAKSQYTCIVCISPSESGIKTIPQWRQSSNIGNHIGNNVNLEEGFYYTPGAADDHELAEWSKGLTPALFWRHYEEILNSNITVDESDEVIHQITKKVKDGEYDMNGNNECLQSPITDSFNTLGNFNCCISIGSKKSGQSPECWEYFDAILNVSEIEYEGFSSRQQVVDEDKFYLHINVKEGKKDRKELEKWMAVAMMFVGVHAGASKRRILIHGTEGKDRSVAVVMAALCIYCRLKLSSSKSNGDMKPEQNHQHPMLTFHPWVKGMSFESILNFASKRLLLEDHNSNSNFIQDLDENEYGCSGMSKLLVNLLLGRPGKGLFFDYIRSISVNEQNGFIQNEDISTTYYATKETLRVALIAIQQHRNKAYPSRKTMQKLNRFFMSHPVPE